MPKSIRTDIEGELRQRTHGGEVWGGVERGGADCGLGGGI